MIHPRCQQAQGWAQVCFHNNTAIRTLQNQKASVRHIEAANDVINAHKKEIDAKISQVEKDKTAMQAQLDGLIKIVEAMQQSVGTTEPAHVQLEDLQSIQD